MTQHSIVIIGSGMAAATLVREFRKLNQETDVLMITADQGDMYSKPMLSNAYAKNKSADDLISADSDQFAQQNNVAIKTLAQVEAIDVESNTLSVNGDSIGYETLVLALGASPFKPPTQGNADDQIITVNTLDEYRLFQQRAEQAKNIAIIGPGLIGCEFANDLIGQDKSIRIIGPDPWPMSNLLSQPVGGYLQQQLENSGVIFELEKTVSEATFSDEKFHLTLSDDTKVEADLVLSAIGLRSNIALAQAAGIQVNRGIQTNQTLQTNIANVYALGDCAEVESLVLPYVMPLMNAARALAKTLNGEATKVTYPAMPVMVKTPACPLVISPPSDKSNSKVESTEQGVQVCYYDANEQLIGFELCGDAVKQKQSLSKLLPPVLA